MDTEETKLAKLRPLSPHLQVYKLPYNARLSIIGRGIGIVLAKILSLIFLCLVAVAWYPPIFDPLMTFLQMPAIAYLMLAGSFAVFFYLANGVRHVLWDFVIGVHHETGFMTGHIAIIVSALLTIALYFIATQNGIEVTK